MGQNRTRGSGTKSRKRRPITNQSNSKRPRLSRRALAWSGGILTTAVAALVAALLTGLPAEIRDLPGTKDRVRDLTRGDEPLRITIVSNHHDNDYSMAFSGIYEPTADQQQMMTGENLNAESVVRLEQEFDEAGGASVDLEMLQIQLEGRRNQQVTIVDIRPRIIRRTAPLSGTMIRIPAEGEPTNRMGINFDEKLPVAREVPEDALFYEIKKWDGRYFEKFTIDLKDQAVQTLILGVITFRHYVEFDLVFTYTLGGVRRTKVVNDNGQPFRLTASNCVKGTDYMSYQRAFANGAVDAWGVGPVKNSARIETDGYCNGIWNSVQTG